MIKLLLTLVMMFAFGTSTVSAEENTASIEDIISELAETKLDRQSTIKAEVDELSEDELKTVIANVNELTEPTEDSLAIKEAAISKLEEMKSVESSNLLAIGIGVIGIILMFSALFMVFKGYSNKFTVPLTSVGILLIALMVLLIKVWVQIWQNINKGE